MSDLNKMRIIKILGSVYPEGLSTTELTNSLKLSRDTVYVLCKELSADGLVNKVNGKRGKYKLTSKAFGDPDLSSFLFGSMALHSLEACKPISSYSEFCKIKYCRRILHNSIQKPLKSDSRKSIYKLGIFDFASMIGAYITYVLIEAINPNRLQPSITSKKVRLIPPRDKKGILVQKWINNALSPSQILNEFEKFALVRNLLARPEIEFDLQTKSNILSQNWSHHDLTDENFLTLQNAFRQVYPELYERLEQLKINVIKELNQTRNKN